MKYLAIDYGKKRIGIAVSDDAGTLAMPYGMRERQGMARDVATIIETLRGLGAEAIVMGLPLNIEGREGVLEPTVRRFGAALQEALAASGTPVPLHWQDERFSTVEALRGLRLAGISQRQARDAQGSGSVDARAAAVILQGFLDAQHSAQDTPLSSWERGRG